MSIIRFLVLIFAFLACGFGVSLNLISPPPRKIPSDHLKIELIFGKNIKSNCLLQRFAGGKIELKRSKELGEYYEFSGGDEIYTAFGECKGKNEMKFVEYDFRAVFPYEELKIIAPKEIKVKYVIFEKIDEKNAKVEKIR